MARAALLFGLNYTGTPGQLSGCINDVHTVATFLKKYQGFTDKDITTITDDTDVKPTLKNIKVALIELAARSNREHMSNVWISYSGHGAYDFDDNGDEKDGRDECLVPLDWETSGCLFDDELQSIFALFNKDTTVTVLIDACHSGTVLDLKYRLVYNNNNPVENTTCNVRANVTMIAGCRDRQVSLELHSVEGGDNVYRGALTSAFMIMMEETMASRTSLTYGQLLRGMVKQMQLYKSKQKPQICSSNLLSHTMPFVGFRPQIIF